MFIDTNISLSLSLTNTTLTPHVPQGVLDRGVLTFFNSRADASSGVRRRGYKYLDNCKVVPMIGGDGAMFIIQYNDGTCHRLAATPDPLHPASINRQVNEYTIGF